MYKGVAGEKEIGETCFNASKGLIWGMSNMRGCCREKKKKKEFIEEDNGICWDNLVSNVIMHNHTVNPSHKVRNTWNTVFWISLHPDRGSYRWYLWIETWYRSYQAVESSAANEVSWHSPLLQTEGYRVFGKFISWRKSLLFCLSEKFLTC